MDKIIRATPEERLRIFNDASATLNIPLPIVEKDFWTFYVLSKLFTNDFLRQALRFKGGTSLSKGYNLIHRFSEDLDLILDKTLILGDEELFKTSYKKQREFVDEIDEKTAHYISSTLKDKIEQLINNDIVMVYTDEEYVAVNLKYNPEKIDNKSLHIVYPITAKDSYLRPDILLEIGIMSARTPFENRNISSHIGDVYSELNINPVSVPTVLPKRTFWDKATILHREHHRAETTHTPQRYSRHYYDLYQLAHSFVKAEALSDIKLLSDVVNRKDKLYHCAWAKYEDCLSGYLRLCPNANNMELLAQDYKDMQGMIYGDYPSWNIIVADLEKLEQEINILLEKP